MIWKQHFQVTFTHNNLDNVNLCVTQVNKHVEDYNKQLFSFKIPSKNEQQSTLIGSKSVKNLEFSARSVNQRTKKLPLIKLPPSKSVKKKILNKQLLQNKKNLQEAK